MQRNTPMDASDLSQGARQMKRRIIISGVCLILAFSITACGESEDKKTGNNSTTVNVAEENETSSDVEEPTKDGEGSFENVGETSSEEKVATGTTVNETTKQPETTKTESNNSGNKNNNDTGSTGGNTSSVDTSSGNDNYKILNNYETLGSRYDKYKNAYKSGNTSGLSGEELTFYKNLKECLDQANSKGTKIDKEKAVHDWIILHCEYDEENYHNDTVPWSSYNPEGVFINGTAVCNGYALAFQLCMEILGIESKIVVGTASFSYHAWNIVKMDDGCWYHVDVTWDDPVPDIKGRINYQYFNITDSYMRSYGRHNFNINEKCDATQYGYWNYYESDILHVSTCEQLYEGIINWIKSGKMTGQVAMEYHSNDFDYFNNMYDYIRVYKATKKEISYRFKMIYEDNGTTHFPNGCAYADFTVYDGSASGDDDEEVIKYISSHAEFESLIKTYSAADDAWRTLNVYLDPVLLESGDYSETFVKTVSVKALQFMNKEYLTGNKTYHIWMAFDYHNDVVTSTEQMIAKIDELCSAKVPGVYEIVYYCGLSGDNEISISNALQQHMSSKYNLQGHGTYADPVMWRVDREYGMEATYIISLTITGK